MAQWPAWERFAYDAAIARQQELQREQQPSVDPETGRAQSQRQGVHPKVAAHNNIATPK